MEVIPHRLSIDAVQVWIGAEGLDAPCFCGEGVPGLAASLDDGVVIGEEPSSVNRTGNALKAARNLVADQHDAVTSRHAWEKGLAALPDASAARNVILSEAGVRSVI